MQYFYCRDCGGVMDEIEALCYVPEVHMELDNHPTEWLAENRCVYCNSDNLEEALRCDGCKEIFPESLLDENWLCGRCREEAEKENATQGAATP